MENEISQSTITRFNNNSYASISNFVTSSTKESLQVSEKDEMCVYSLPNKTSNTYFNIMNFLCVVPSWFDLSMSHNYNMSFLVTQL